MKIKELFAIPIASETLDLDLNEIKNFCIQKRKLDNGREISNEGGWQSNLLRLNEMELQDLYSSINKLSSEFSKNIGLKKEIHISNAWININGFKDYNVEHIHPNCLLSGVFYVKVPEKSGNICFHHPASDHMSYDWTKDVTKEYNRFTSLGWNIESKENTLYMFPSWLKHKVKPNLNENEERISIAFNLK